MLTRLAGALGLAALLLGCSPPAETPAPEAAPESVFFLVRHAEKADQSEDPPLTEAGQSRAKTLAEMLRDAGVERIYSSDFERTRDTAAPLANELGLEVTLYDPNQLPDLAAALVSSPGRYLVVGHSNTTPELAGLLGGDPGTPISEDEYDRLYVLVHRPGSETTTLLLRFEPR
ncbi:MAG: histidine phosphatase family protein [Acidobacteria bacterium]|nr:histidine phosphatase family protein [Acidobacteriota bacterium]